MNSNLSSISFMNCGELFLMVEYQLINTEGVMELKNDHFAAFIESLLIQWNNQCMLKLDEEAIYMVLSIPSKIVSWSQRENSKFTVD